MRKTVCLFCALFNVVCVLYGVIFSAFCHTRNVIFFYRINEAMNASVILQAETQGAANQVKKARRIYKMQGNDKFSN